MRGVDYVFHAAALKQVPSCEFFLWKLLKPMFLGLRMSLMPGAIKLKKSNLFEYR
jgi:hypothetical protein